MTDRRIEIADITRVNEIIQDDSKALIIKAYDDGRFAVNYYESRGARKRREDREAQIRQYEEWKAREQQQPQPAQANGEVRRGPGRPPKNQVEQITSPQIVSENQKSKGIFHRKDKVVQPSNRCVICGSPDANIVKFHVPGAPTDGETRFCKNHSNVTDLTGITQYQVG